MFAPFSLETELLARWKANTLENAQPRAAFRKKRAMFRRPNFDGACGTNCLERAEENARQLTAVHSAAMRKASGSS
jgi:hypothetical protein